MPLWESTPPSAADGHPLRIIRTPSSKPISAVVTTPDSVGCRTHFLNNRTVPCEGPDKCESCHDGHSWRWHGYVAALNTATLEHFIFEFTAAASETFKNYYNLKGDLRGCWFTAHRPSGRHNGRIVISAKPSDPQRTHLPEPPDIRRILCHIWGVQYTKTREGARLRYPSKEITVDPSNGDRRERPRNPAPPK